MRPTPKKRTIFVLTGGVHAGKTTWLKRFVCELRARGIRLHGFLSVAVIENGRTVGYDLCDLSGRSSVPYLRERGEKDWEKAGRFYFLPQGLERARKAILSLRTESLLVVDEVGPCELEGRGVRVALDQVISRAKGVSLLVIRKSLVHDFLDVLPRARVRVLELSEIGNGEKLLDELGRSGMRRCRP